ncbi:S1C family serine protease [Parasphingopyxis lamellibrachiae]|uniref:Trypsin-like peptidase n=1 Tax=Parasphingopyxis lamellibrachiae TaxID=680125 RepID=A0A3D9FC33_9SPHN|nr:trypsin-like peptidase domain-containing protein [Parasphingopyxis lamellibrachiae]RED15172.1 trypsin-like peptidase [Parasphingopyxis lamellibrachiae]
MARWITVLLALFALLPIAASAQKGEEAASTQNDVVVAARSVVRVALIANDPKQGEYLLGHGSGVAIAPGLIVTNAHVVAPLRESPNISISIVPSSGDERYPGRLLSSDTRADLALIRMEEDIVEPLSVFTGSPPDTGRVAAIGYPGSVDLAENLSASERVRPIPAVRTFGQLSGGRSRRDVDTLLHTAAMARGNSGGPLVDECGRVIGINSFGSLAEQNDAEFGFAISAREIIPFLQRADVRAEITTESCIPSPERARQSAAEEQRAADRAREQRRQQLYEMREFGLAIAVALLVIGAVMFLGGIIAMFFRGRWRPGTLVGGLGIVVGFILMAGSVYVFFNRPSLASLYADTEAEEAATPEETATDGIEDEANGEAAE